jgi:aspartyl/asparaginyl-tRNA synthetase
MRYKKIIDLELGTNKFQAFVQNIRIKKNIIFIIVNDISSELQVTVLNKNENLFNIASKLSIGSVINLEGELVSNPNVILNQKEFLPTNIEIVNLAEELPIDENSLIDHKIKYR